VSPVTVGAVAVFAQGDVLYGLGLADGHRLWSRAVSQDIAGMWPGQNLIVVLTQPASGGLPRPVLTGLDVSTGQPRWRLPIGGSVAVLPLTPGGGVVEALSPTADGGLAIARGDGVLEVVDLSSGRVRWARSVSEDGFPPVAVGGGAVLAGGAVGDSESLTSYDDLTGQVRWTEALSYPPDDVVWQASTGLLYLTGHVQSVAGAELLLGISAADGRVQWRVVFRFEDTSPPASLDPYAPGLMSFTTSAYSGGTSQDELDPVTGRVRWQVVSPYPAIATPAGIVTAPGPDQITMHDPLTGQTLWTASLTGGWLPLVAGPEQPSPAPPASQALPVFPAGPLLVVRAASPDGADLLAAFSMSDGHPAWQITLPGTLSAPVSATAGGMLVYTVIPPTILAP
jgi:outer membrane protein assembly factor BamB